MEQVSHPGLVLSGDWTKKARLGTCGRSVGCKAYGLALVRLYKVTFEIGKLTSFQVTSPLRASIVRIWLCVSLSFWKRLFRSSPDDVSTEIKAIEEGLLKP